MIEKITPLTFSLTLSLGWLLYSSMFDYRRYYFSTMPYTYYPTGSRVREIELEKLGKVYKY